MVKNSIYSWLEVSRVTSRRRLLDYRNEAFVESSLLPLCTYARPILYMLLVKICIIVGVHHINR